MLTRLLAALLAVSLLCSPARAALATFDDLGTIRADEADGASRALNTLYLEALGSVRAPAGWRSAEIARTRAHLAHLGGAAPFYRDAHWLASARRFVRDYAEEQARLARLAPSTPSEIAILPGERAGWELPDRTLLMSFDDGPNPATTPRIQRTLRAEKVPAVFFVLGKNLQSAREAGRLPAYGGFTVGSHTWSHRYLAGTAAETVRRELVSTGAEMKRDGLGTPNLFRPPYGALRERELRIAEGLGLRSILWNIDAQDWNEEMHRPGRIEHRVIALALLRRHGIVLCHDIQAATAGDLGAMLGSLRRLGFRFASPDALRTP
jgi:peptidoglycan/xylan/chitin deacetylase (PgdA/CDA1 family)